MWDSEIAEHGKAEITALWKKYYASRSSEDIQSEPSTVAKRENVRFSSVFANAIQAGGRAPSSGPEQYELELYLTNVHPCTDVDGALAWWKVSGTVRFQCSTLLITVWQHHHC